MTSLNENFKDTRQDKTILGLCIREISYDKGLKVELLVPTLNNKNDVEHLLHNIYFYPTDQLQSAPQWREAWFKRYPRNSDKVKCLTLIEEILKFDTTTIETKLEAFARYEYIKSIENMIKKTTNSEVHLGMNYNKVFIPALNDLMKSVLASNSSNFNKDSIIQMINKMNR